MKEKIYRTVPVTERLPEKSGVYIIETDKGLVRTCMFVGGDFRSTAIGGDVNVKKDVVQWLEEIDLNRSEDTYNKLRILIKSLEDIIHGSDSQYGLMDVIDPYYADTFAERLKMYENLKNEIT